MSLNLVGCNSGKQLQGDLYQRELRLQEDEIYRLEDNLEEYQAIVRGYRCEVDDLRRELTDAQSQPQVITPVEGPSFQPTPAGEIDIKPFPAPEAAEAPPFAPGADANDPRSGHTATLAQHKSSLRRKEEGEEKAPLSKKTNAKVAKKRLAVLDDVDPPLPFPATRAIPIAESASGTLPVATLPVEPLNVDRSPNESTPTQRIATFVEPVPMKTAPQEKATPLLKLATVDSVRVRLKNGPPEITGEATLLAKLSPLTDGEAAYFEGEASILLADMSRRGTRRRIGRWDFSADEVAQSWAEDSTQLELPLLLPAELVSKTPTDRPLRLWVRLVDSHGRKTLHSIDVDFLDHPWRLAGTRPVGSLQARPIEMASLPLRRLPTENDEPSEEPKQERVAKSDPTLPNQSGPNQSGWKRAVLHRSNARSAPKRDDAVTPAAFLAE